ncbi:MAG: hypothetical protein ACLPWS_00800 [Rhodomicrobium sp.]
MNSSQASPRKALSALIRGLATFEAPVKIPDTARRAPFRDDDKAPRSIQPDFILHRYFIVRLCRNFDYPDIPAQLSKPDRQAATADETALKNRYGAAESGLVKRLLKKQLTACERMIAKLEETIAPLIVNRQRRRLQ